MNKKMREILAKIQAKNDEMKGFIDGEKKDLDKAESIQKEIEELQRQFKIEQNIYENEKALGFSNAKPHTNAEKATSEQVLAKEVRAIINPTKYGADKALVESVGEDGGYTVPEDIQTAVKTFPEVIYSFLDDINSENVTTNKGSRTYQNKADTDAFVDIDEGGEIKNEITSPTFKRISYAIQDRAGFMPVTNDLLNDSDANINNIITTWLGRANIATANAKVLKIVKAKDETNFEDLDGIKKALNVTLGQAYKGGSKIYTNDDGLNYLDTLKDANGRYMLNPDPTDSAKLQLRCGVHVLPVKVIPNQAWATSDSKVPFIVGDLKAAITRYDRQNMTLDSSSVASIGSFNAFAMNMTLIRAIVRDDYQEVDPDAYVYGYITVTDSTESEDSE